MIKKLTAIGFALLLSVGAISGCGEKGCNQAGSTKAEKGILYTCADRGNGAGLKWYKS